MARATTIDRRSSRQAAQMLTPAMIATRETSPTIAAGRPPIDWPHRSSPIAPATTRLPTVTARNSDGSEKAGLDGAGAGSTAMPSVVSTGAVSPPFADSTRRGSALPAHSQATTATATSMRINPTRAIATPDEKGPTEKYGCAWPSWYAMASRIQPRPRSMPVPFSSATRAHGL